MGTATKPYAYSPNTTISSSEMNANLDTIYNEFNGSIDATNLASNAVTGAKIADSNVTTAKIDDGDVTSAVLGADSVTATKIDWASTGANAGIWWEEIGRTTLTAAGDAMNVTIPVRKYLQVIVAAIPSGAIDINLRFNADTSSATTYAHRRSTNAAADGSTTSSSGYSLNPDANTAIKYATVFIVNVAGQEKLVMSNCNSQNATGAGTAPARREVAAKYANTTDPITVVQIYNVAAGDLAIGSSVIVLGHN